MNVEKVSENIYEIKKEHEMNVMRHWREGLEERLVGEAVEK